LVRNQELTYVCPHYFSLPVRLYYSVLIYVQILRAKEQAGLLKKSEGSWLRAFLRRFKDTQLPVAGPLVPLFSQIVSVLPQSSLFDYVSPTAFFDKFYNSAADGKSACQGHSALVLPYPRLITSQILTFCKAKLGDFANGTDDTDGLRYFDDDGSFRVAPLDKDECILAGISLKKSTASEKSHVLLNPAITAPAPEDETLLKGIHGYWKRSKIAALAKTENWYKAVEKYEPKTVSEITGLIEDFEFFQDAVDMATVQVKFFTDSTTLANIPTTGGPSALIDVRLYAENLADNATGRTLPVTISDWYPTTWSKFGYTSRCFESKIEQDEVLTAAYALTCGTVNWNSNGNAVNGYAAGYRTGPYWVMTYNKFGSTTDEVATRDPIYLMDEKKLISGGIETMIRTQFYVYDGSA